MSRRYRKRLIALMLALSVGMWFVPLQPLYAVEETKKNEEIDKTEYERIEIATAEEFAAFAANCHIDSWSENKYIYLQKDIDLSTISVEPIAVFGGIFDGAGHTISGFTYTGDGYVTGLFRYIGIGGMVQNLAVKGTIDSANEKECIGSICGINYGTIKNCSFQGTASGRDTVGGIVGINESTGIVSSCSAKGRITGYYSTGGICGINHGTLHNCTNRAGVNDNSAWVEEDDEMGGILQALTSNDENELYSGVDTGGIAGYSDGMISSCNNVGTVGYDHTGYNIGGIVGRQSGVVSLCTNSGTVYGRKDVGGIVGQMEPFVEINEAESLRDAVNKLHDLIEKTIDDMQEAKNVVKNDVDIMQTFADYAIDAGDALADQLANFVDTNIDQVNSVSQRMEDVLEMLPGVLDTMTRAGDGMTEFNENMKRVTQDLDVLSKLDDSAYAKTQSRLSLLSSVGGVLISDSVYPEAGKTVTITIKPDDGYGLMQNTFVVQATNGQIISSTDIGDNRYTFVMPEESVQVMAQFEYVGTLLVESTVGGEVEVLKQGSEVKITARASKGYQFDSFEVAGTRISDSEVSNNGGAYSITVNKNIVVSNHTSVTVKAFFVESSGGNTQDRITTVSSTGGVVAVSTQDAQSGTQVYALPAAADGYVLKELKVINQSSNQEILVQQENGGKRYSFIMPSDNVKVTALFVPIHIKLESNLSGIVSYSGDREGIVELRIKPDTAYTVAVAPSVTDAVGQNIAVSKKQSGTIYEFDIRQTNQFPCTVYIAFQKQNNKQAVETAQKEIQESTQRLEAISSKVQETTNRINHIANGKFWSELDVSQRQAIITEMFNLADDIGEMSTEASSIVSNLTTIYNILEPYAVESAKEARADLKKSIDAMQSVVDSLKESNNGMKGIINYMNAQPDVRFAQLGPGYDATKENFHNQLKALSDSMKNISDNASAYSDRIHNDLRAVNDQMNVVFNILADRIVSVESLALDELYEDVDDDAIDTITTGKTDTCTNKGVIKGDINVGGIAGAMAIDNEDLEGNAAGTVEYEIGRRFITKCLVINSVNEGYITAKKDGAGGICGYMSHGIVMDCEGYGSVESIEGGYVGGICGESLTIIKRCYALCSASGTKNVGGIAGYANTLKDCYAMASVEADQGRAGAIAGQIASYEEIDLEASDGKPKVFGNYYVGEMLNGIDNVSYLGIAQPICYQDLLAVDQLPAPFRHLKVIYKVEDTYLGSEEIEYGALLDNLHFPQIPERTGFYGVWPDLSNTIMTGNLVVMAQYKDTVTVVQSSDKEVLPEGEQRAEKPYALVEDLFTEDTTLTVIFSDQNPPQEIAQNEYIIYEVSLENSDIKETDSFALRILNPYEDAIVYGYKDGEWTELESKSRGQYLQVTMTGNKQLFCIAEHTFDKMWIVTIIVSAGCLLLLVIAARKLIGRKIKK